MPFHTTAAKSPNGWSSAPATATPTHFCGISAPTSQNGRNKQLMKGTPLSQSCAMTRNCPTERNQAMAGRIRAGCVERQVTWNPGGRQCVQTANCPNEQHREPRAKTHTVPHSRSSRENQGWQKTAATTNFRANKSPVSVGENPGVQTQISTPRSQVE